MAKRRGQGKALFKQRADGGWMARISLGWKDGKRQVKIGMYRSTQEDVAKQLRMTLVNRDHGKNIDDRDVPAYPREFAAGWLENDPTHAQAVVMEVL